MFYEWIMVSQSLSSFSVYSVPMIIAIFLDSMRNITCVRCLYHIIFQNTAEMYISSEFLDDNRTCRSKDCDNCTNNKVNIQQKWQSLFSLKKIVKNQE